MNKKLLITGAAALILVSAAEAQAQSRARATTASASSPPVRSLAEGPAIPGICVFFQGRGIGTSTVGKAFEARMQQLRGQAAAEVSAEQASLTTDIKAFQAKRASLTQEQLAQQAQPLQQRGEVLNQKATQRNAELEYTFRHQLSRIAQTLDPIIQSVYQERHCSILMNGDSDVMASNTGMDITPAVVQQLNGRLTTITFDRETPPAGAGQ